MIKSEIISAYSPDTDMTFIIKETTKEENGEEKYVSTEVIDFYYGSPHEDYNELYQGRLKAEY